MGGSILGTEAIYNFKKKKKKILFFNDINEDGILKLKKRKKYQIFYLLLYQSQATL